MNKGNLKIDTFDSMTNINADGVVYDVPCTLHKLNVGGNAEQQFIQTVYNATGRLIIKHSENNPKR